MIEKYFSLPILGWVVGVVWAYKKGNLNTTGLFAVTLGGSRGLSAGISSDGLDLSLNSIKNLTKGMKRAGEYGNMTSVSNKEKNAVYIAENLMLYSGVSEDDDILKQIESYLYGEKGAINIDFSTEENKRDGNTIYLNKNYIGGMNYDGHTVIVNNFNQYAILGAKLGHELYHDGINTLTDQQSSDIQTFMKENAGLSKEEMLQKITELYGEAAAASIAEEIGAFDFEIDIWKKLQNTFGVRDYELDNLSAAKQLNNGSNYLGYLGTFYTLGKDRNEIQEHSEADAETSMYLYNQNTILQQRAAGQEVSQESLNALYIARWGFVSNIGLNNYNAQYFNNDLKAFFNISLLEDGNDENSLQDDYDSLVATELYYQNITETQARTQIGNSFNNVFSYLYFSDDGVQKFNILKDDIASRIETRYTGTAVGNEGNQGVPFLNTTMWLFNTYSLNSVDTFNQNPGGPNNRRYSAGGGLDDGLSQMGRWGQNGRMSFFQYYLTRDVDDLQTVAALLENKTIYVDQGADRDANNGRCDTFFIANIDLLVDSLHAINNATGGTNGEDGTWTSFVLREGYRNGTAKNGNQHAMNNAMDILYINYTHDGQAAFLGQENANVTTADKQHRVRNQWDVLESFRESGYFSFIEYKGTGTGFHIGRNTATLTSTNTYAATDVSLYFGSTREWTSRNEDGTYNYPDLGTDSTNGDSYDAAYQVLTTMLNVSSLTTAQWNQYCTYSNGYYIINWSTVDALVGN